ncbi:MAG: MFS transporter [Eggerthella lenta]
MRARRGLRPHRHGSRGQGGVSFLGSVSYAVVRIAYRRLIAKDAPPQRRSRGDRLACLQLHEKALDERFRIRNRRELPVMVNYYGLMVVVADYAMKTYDAPAATAGLAASIFVIGALIARLFSGRIMDRVGRKRLLIIGAVLEVAFSALYLTGLGLWLLFALRLLHGIAFGTCSTAIGTIVTALVPDNRIGEGVGYYMLSVTLGAAIRAVSGHVSHAERRIPNVVPRSRRRSSGLLASRHAAARAEKPCIGRNRGPEGERHRPRRTHRAGGRVPRASSEPDELPGIQRDPHRRRMRAAVLLRYSSLLAFLTPFAAENGLETPASFFFVVYAIATFVTRPFTGKLFDRKGDRVVMVPAFIAFIVGMGLLATVYQPTAMLIAAALLGFGGGTVQARPGSGGAPRPDDHSSGELHYILLDIGVGAAAAFGHRTATVGLSRPVRGMSLVPSWRWRPASEPQGRHAPQARKRRNGKQPACRSKRQRKGLTTRSTHAPLSIVGLLHWSIAPANSPQLAVDVRRASSPCCAIAQPSWMNGRCARARQQRDSSVSRGVSQPRGGGAFSAAEAAALVAQPTAIDGCWKPPGEHREVHRHERNSTTAMPTDTVGSGWRSPHTPPSPRQAPTRPRVPTQPASAFTCCARR